jgi:Flp pilus assembly protein TadD
MAKAHTNLGLAYLNLGALDKAGKSLNEAARLSPNDAQAHYALCVYYARTGDSQAANREFQTVQKLDPTLAQKLTSLMRPGTAGKKKP